MIKLFSSRFCSTAILRPILSTQMVKRGEIIDGEVMSSQIYKNLVNKISFLGSKKPSYSSIPTLACIVVGDHKNSVVYVDKKKKSCEKVGINFTC